MTGRRDILEEWEAERSRPRWAAVEVRPGMVVEDAASGFCGDVVSITAEGVTLRDRRGDLRNFRFKPGGFRLEGRVVTLVRPAATRGEPVPRRTASGSVAAATPAPARTARASRIWVEGRHDAELLEHVWGDDLRELGIVVEPLHGVDDVVAQVAGFAPGPTRRLGILVDHLVPGSKEERLAAEVQRGHHHVLVVGHPFVDVWEAVWPRHIGRDAWPQVPPGRPWKEGVCAALGVDPQRFWPQLRNRVHTFADLRPELVGAVERLIDFVGESVDG